jgi:hypothetical protein
VANILCIGDIHEPVSRKNYLEFNLDLCHEWSCDYPVFLGDLADWHAISFHAHHPELPGPNDEFELAYEKIQKWYQAFPEAKVCIGNHDDRLIRLAESVNIPKKFLRNFNEVWDTPGWDWDYSHIIDDVYYFHGTGNGGIYPAPNAAKKMLMSVVMGHCHTAAGIKWLASPQRRIFGMDVGCGIDDKAFNFAYGRHVIQRSIIAAGVVLDGIPYHEIMPIGKGERYYDGNK